MPSPLTWPGEGGPDHWARGEQLAVKLVDGERVGCLRLPPAAFSVKQPDARVKTAALGPLRPRPAGARDVSNVSRQVLQHLDFTAGQWIVSS